MSDEDETWPPPGFTSSYAVTEHLDGHKDLSYDFVLPSTFSTVDLSTVRIGRHGGPNDDDLRFRSELYFRIGAITVAGGHVETAMKRLLLVLMATPKAHFALVDETWSQLHKKLRKEANGSDERRTRLGEVLDWGEEHNVKRRRDDAVHAYWWDYSGCGARRSRFVRHGNGKTILASVDDLDEDARLLFDYAQRLDSLLGADWIIARLQRQGDGS